MVLENLSLNDIIKIFDDIKGDLTYDKKLPLGLKCIQRIHNDYGMRGDYFKIYFDIPLNLSKLQKICKEQGYDTELIDKDRLDVKKKCVSFFADNVKNLEEKIQGEIHFWSRSTNEKIVDIINKYLGSVW